MEANPFRPECVAAFSLGKIARLLGISGGITIPRFYRGPIPSNSTERGTSVKRRPAPPTLHRNPPAHAPEDAPALRTRPPATAAAAAHNRWTSSSRRRLPLVAKTFKQPQDRAPLLLRHQQIGLQDLVYQRRMRIQLRARPCLSVPIGRRDRVPRHLFHRATISPEPARSLALAHAIP